LKENPFWGIQRNSIAVVTHNAVALPSGILMISIQRPKNRFQYQFYLYFHNGTKLSRADLQIANARICPSNESVREKVPLTV
jgi:hypothetical protein